MNATDGEGEVDSGEARPESGAWRRLTVWRALAESWWRWDGDDHLARLRRAESLVHRDEDDAERREALAALFSTLSGRQILTMLRRGGWGCDDLNLRLAHTFRAAWDPDAPAAPDESASAGFAAGFSGAPMLATRNDYQRNLFNGAVGIALRARADRQLRVVFPTDAGRYRAFRPDHLPGLAWGFALTVHKSQGSEYGEVLLGIPPLRDGIGERMLTRELLYTGVTRARRRAAVFGDRTALLATLSRRVVRHSGMDWWAPRE